jgi:hypothetical protein
MSNNPKVISLFYSNLKRYEAVAVTYLSDENFVWFVENFVKTNHFSMEMALAMAMRLNRANIVQYLLERWAKLQINGYHNLLFCYKLLGEKKIE